MFRQPRLWRSARYACPSPCGVTATAPQLQLGPSRLAHRSVVSSTVNRSTTVFDREVDEEEPTEEEALIKAESAARKEARKQRQQLKAQTRKVQKAKAKLIAERNKERAERIEEHRKAKSEHSPRRGRKNKSLEGVGNSDGDIWASMGEDLMHMNEQGQAAAKSGLQQKVEAQEEHAASRQRRTGEFEEGDGESAESLAPGAKERGKKKKKKQSRDSSGRY